MAKQFPSIKSQNDEDHMPTVIHNSLCMQCQSHEGTTQLLLTSIPHFKELIIAAFECPDCGFHNNSVESAHSIAPLGLRYELEVKSQQDLNRRVVKGEHASLSICKANENIIEIPSGTQRGILSTVEGFVTQCIEDIKSTQDQRFRVAQQKILLGDQDKEGTYMMALWEQLNGVTAKLEGLLELKNSFLVVLDDPSGNSVIEGFGEADQQIRKSEYERTDEHNSQIGLNPEDEKRITKEESVNATEIQEVVEIMQRQLYERDLKNKSQPVEQSQLSNEVTAEEVMSFPSACPNCHAQTECKMKLISIPYFKEVLIMATACDADSCGYKSNEVKASGCISEKGRKIKLLVTCQDDLNRDVLKSETCGISIPELDLSLAAYTLGGRFTTIEGLLTQIRDELHSRLPFLSGDSDVLNHTVEKGDRSDGHKMREFLAKLQKCIDFEQQFSFVMDDPLGASYLSNPYAPDSDPEMVIVDYDRSHEQNEELGLNDMDVTTGVTYE